MSDCNSPYDSFSNSLAETGAFGQNSIFYKGDRSYSEIFTQKPIRLRSFLKDLKSKREFQDIPFDFSDYSNERIAPNTIYPTNENAFPTSENPTRTYPYVDLDALAEHYFDYIDSEGEKKSGRVDIKLNTRKGCLDKLGTYHIKLGDIDEPLEISYRKYYKGTLDLLEITEEGKIIPEDKYTAYVVSSNNIETFLAFFRQIDTNHSLIPTLEKHFLEKLFFSTGEKLSNYYSKAPIQSIHMLSWEKKLDHFHELVKTDASWNFVDTSSGLRKLLIAVGKSEADLYQLYSSLNENPQFIMDVHEALEGGSGSAEFKKTETIPRQSAFAYLMTTITGLVISNSYSSSDVNSLAKEENSRAPHLRNSISSVFIEGDDYRITTSGSQLNQGKLTLIQERKQWKSYTYLNTLGVPSKGSTLIWTEERRLELHPLDLITVLHKLPDNKFEGIPSTAIHAYDIAYQRESRQLAHDLRLALNIVYVYFSILEIAAGVGTANPFVIALGAAGLTLAISDLYVQGNLDKYSKEFLEKYERDFLTINFALGAANLPILLTQLTKLGLVALRFAPLNTRHYILGALMKVLFEVKAINRSLPRFSIIYVNQNATIGKPFFNQKLLEQLNKEGVDLVRFDNIENRTVGYCFIMRGSPSIIGSFDDINDIMKQLSKKSRKGLINYIEAMAAQSIKGLTLEGKEWVFVNKFGTSLRWSRQSTDLIATRIGQKLQKTKLTPGDRFEAEVAREHFRLAAIHGDELTDYSNKVRRLKDNGKFEPAGDRDSSSFIYMGEAKLSLTNSGAVNELFEQTRKYVDDEHRLFMNPMGLKRYIVYQTAPDWTNPKIIQMIKEDFIFIEGIENMQNFLYK